MESGFYTDKDIGYGEFMANIKVFRDSRKKEFEYISLLEVLYELAALHGYSKSFEEVTSSIENIFEFLQEASKISLAIYKNDPSARESIERTKNELIVYLTDAEKLQEVSVPSYVVDKIQDSNYVPNEQDVRFIMWFSNRNRMIFEEDLEDRDLSITIDRGLHLNITEQLAIKKENLGHLLGFTGDVGSLTQFYRKCMIEDIVKERFGNISFQQLENNQEFLDFFKQEFGLEYSKENYIKLINCKYIKPSDDLTDEERSLSAFYNRFGNSKTVYFYSSQDSVNRVVEESNHVKQFCFEYLLDVVKNIKNVQQLNSLLGRKSTSAYTALEFNKIKSMSSSSNPDELLQLMVGYNFDGDSNFKTKFLSEFGYSYPLLRFSKMMAKNISFLNFSTFQNVNRIIVDYRGSTNISSDVFLVSCNEESLIQQKGVIDKTLQREFDMHCEAIKTGDVDNTRLNPKILSLVSMLMSFAPEERMKFRFRRTFRSYDPNEDAPKKDGVGTLENSDYFHKLLKSRGIQFPQNMSLYGFVTNGNESDRLVELRSIYDGELTPFTHAHRSETALSTNYLEFLSDYATNGVVYPISNIFSGEDRRLFRLPNLMSKIELYMNQLMTFEVVEDYHQELLNEYEIVQKLEKIIKFVKETYDSLDKSYDSRREKSNYDYLVKCLDYLNEYSDLLVEEIISVESKDKKLHEVDNDLIDFDRLRNDLITYYETKLNRNSSVLYDVDDNKLVKLALEYDFDLRKYRKKQTK